MLLKKSQVILIIGCGRLGASLAGMLSAQRFNVTVIDKDGDSFRKLPQNFSGYTLDADATDIDTLARVGIAETDMVIVTTESDNINSFIAQIASRIYNVPKVYIRLNDTEKEKLIDGFNIEVIYPFKLSIEEFQRLSAVDLSEVVL